MAGTFLTAVRSTVRRRPQRPLPQAWVLVVGMHRSGTSAVTGVLHELGLAVPAAADLMAGRRDNPNHYESIALTAFNDRLLEAVGSSLWPPYDMPAPGWEHSDAATAFDKDAIDAAVSAFPEDSPRVWKDPRLCLVLPYWRRLIPESTPVVFTWRDGDSVAKSLRERDGFKLIDARALWERYNRHALEGMRGMNVFSLEYDALLEDPPRWCSALASWLRRSLKLRTFNQQRGVAAAATVSSVHRHHASAAPGADPVSALLAGLPPGPMFPFSADSRAG